MASTLPPPEPPAEKHSKKTAKMFMGGSKSTTVDTFSGRSVFRHRYLDVNGNSTEDLAVLKAIRDEFLCSIGAQMVERP